ncbi:MAG: carbohydrate ABC transporter permease [Anaerolineae bacterium]|nr:carbohydrate ABC transporter permease [Anaerolineae bacterium]
MPMRNTGDTAGRGTWLLTGAAAIIWMLPLIFAVLVSFRPQAEPVSIGNIFFGSRITLDNYAAAWNIAPWGWHYVNSILFVVGVLAVQIVTVTMAGYAFARLRFAGRGLLLVLILLQLMIPTAALLAQNFATIRTLGLYDTRWALMMPYWGSAFGVLLMRQTFRGVPLEFEEAARIDGANWWQIMRSVYIPLALPAYIAFALVSISSHWNEFLWPFIVTRTEEVRPLTVGLNKLYSTTELGALYGQLMAGTLMVIAPLVVLFMLFQRRFLESFASSGLK